MKGWKAPNAHLTNNKATLTVPLGEWLLPKTLSTSDYMNHPVRAR